MCSASRGGSGLAAALLLSLFIGAAQAQQQADCGERPRGQNPSMDELAGAIEELSLAFQVPMEVIKAVAHRESSVQQWRPDGSLVVNEQDCGLGMMQLTGATAELFDVERLKSDWRYNLEAGVTVLEMKWRAALRLFWRGKDLPPPDPAILENWYYPLSLYQGRRTGEYPGKVLDHMRERPGRLMRLLAAPVEVSNPDDAIEGFTYGQVYTALEGDRIIHEDGRTLAVPTTLGTIGDPALLEQLGEALRLAERARAQGDTRRAIRLLQAVIEKRADAPQARAAGETLAALAAEARERIAAGERLAEGGDHAGALAQLDAVEGRYAGLPEAEEARRRAEAIRRDPALRAQAARLEAERRARRLLDRAERAERGGRLGEALRLLRAVAERHDGTEAAALAQDRLRALEADAAALEAAQADQVRRAVRSALALADGYRANGLYERAIERYEEALRLDPDGPEAERARAGLTAARAGAAGR